MLLRSASSRHHDSEGSCRRASGEYLILKYGDVVALDYHGHHVSFVDHRRLVVNHIQNGNGMWIVNLDGSGRRALRPPDDHGWPIHRLVTRPGICNEAVDSNARSGAKNWFGLYDLSADKFEEVPLPIVDGYMHTGWDPEDRFLFFENHERYHAHPLRLYA